MDDAAHAPGQARADARGRDAALVRLAKAGDDQAFDALVRSHETPLRKLVYGYVLDWEVAGDVAQDAFLLAWRKLDGLGEPAAFRSWLYRIAINRAHDELRRKARSRRFMDPGADEETVAEIPAPGAESAVESGLLRHTLVRALSRLSPSQRTAVVLKDVAGMKYVEIAALLECPVGTAQIRVHRGRRKLRRLLEEPTQHRMGGGTR